MGDTVLQPIETYDLGDGFWLAKMFQHPVVKEHVSYQIWYGERRDNVVINRQTVRKNAYHENGVFHVLRPLYTQRHEVDVSKAAAASEIIDAPNRYVAADDEQRRLTVVRDAVVKLSSALAGQRLGQQVEDKVDRHLETLRSVGLSRSQALLAATLFAEERKIEPRSLLETVTAIA